MTEPISLGQPSPQASSRRVEICLVNFRRVLILLFGYTEGF